MAKKKKINTMSLQSYKATLSQSGSDNPTVNEFVNDGFDGSWARASIGSYFKETTITNPLENKFVWIAGTAMSSDGGTRYHVYKGQNVLVGFYTVQYAWQNLKLRFVVKCFDTNYQPIELSSLLPEYNELFLPEIILKTP